MKIFGFGNLTKDPDKVTVTQNGESKYLCKFCIAENMPNGEAQFFNVVAWNKLAEACLENLKCGSSVCIFGELNNHSYETASGEKRIATEIIAKEIRFIKK